MDVKTLSLAMCALVAAYFLARILWLFTSRTPVLARSENMDALGETLPCDPLNPSQPAVGAKRSSPVRARTMKLEYELDGKSYEHDNMTHMVEGLAISAPDDMPILWADPSNPTQIEAHGPGFWAAGLVIVSFAAVAIYNLM